MKSTGVLSTPPPAPALQGFRAMLKRFIQGETGLSRPGLHAALFHYIICFREAWEPGLLPATTRGDGQGAGDGRRSRAPWQSEAWHVGEKEIQRTGESAHRQAAVRGLHA